MAGRTTPRAIEIQEKQRRALQMRRGGAQLDEIAQRLGYATCEGARKAILTALKRNEVGDVETLRAQELDRLDRMWAAVWPDVISPETSPAQRNFAVDRCIRIVEQRRALLGLDAPQKTDLEIRIRTVARENGLDEAEAVAEARRYLKEARGLA